ncbi:YdcF family protein [Epibacterium ulvae]|uniref:YdcF family protein n=1 Tax=Epibacterium ulvae TaxID=1156985 RepID=UPI001BFCBDF2|nr:YdcF family protein [Epibacterium ulvae]MBT8154371.1 YdcF family protein [Epibacterium ulvae]
MTKAGVFLGLLTYGAVNAWTHLWPNQRFENMRPATAIVCLAAGLRHDGTMGRFTEARARRCIAAYHAGLAPTLAFTGGNSSHDAPPTGTQMAALAQDLGVPADAIVIESQSESTLQNALFTLPKLDSTSELILVTDSFHLPRSAVSFWWAGARDMQMLAADPDVTWGEVPQMLLIAETVKFWANGLRAPVYSLAGALGIPNSARLWIVE